MQTDGTLARRAQTGMARRNMTSHDIPDSLSAFGSRPLSCGGTGGMNLPAQAEDRA